MSGHDILLDRFSVNSNNTRSFAASCRLATPYEALCMGIPFLNPIQSVRHFPSALVTSMLTRHWQWDNDHPDDRSRWVVSNTIAKSLPPPYVYNVWREDENAFMDSFRGAVSNPVERYVFRSRFAREG